MYITAACNTDSGPGYGVGCPPPCPLVCVAPLPIGCYRLLLLKLFGHLGFCCCLGWSLLWCWQWGGLWSWCWHRQEGRGLVVLQSIHLVGHLLHPVYGSLGVGVKIVALPGIPGGLRIPGGSGGAPTGMTQVHTQICEAQGRASQGDTRTPS